MARESGMDLLIYQNPEAKERGIGFYFEIKEINFVDELLELVPGLRDAGGGICATDLQMIAGWKRTGFPSVPGHEWSGVVDAVGAGVDAALVGKHW